MNYTISNELSDQSGIAIHVQSDIETLISKPVFREIRRTDYARMNSLLISDLYYSEAPTVMNVSERIGYMMSVIKSRLVECTTTKRVRRNGKEVSLDQSRSEEIV